MEHCGTLSSYWRKYGTIMTLPRTGHPSEIDEVTKKRPCWGDVQEAKSNMKGVAGIPGVMRRGLHSGDTI